MIFNSTLSRPAEVNRRCALFREQNGTLPSLIRCNPRDANPIISRISQNTDICRDIVFRRSLGTRVRGATGASLQRRHRDLMGGTLGRGSRLPNNGHRRHGAEGSKHHRKRVEPIFSGWAAGKAIYFAAEALQPFRRLRRG